MATTAATTRRKVRFKPDLNTLAVVSLSPRRITNFVGLVIDESIMGCRVAFLESVPFNEGDEIEIAVGRIAPLKAEVKWRKNVSLSLCEIGFRFFE